MGNIINVLKTCKDSGKAKVHIKTQKTPKTTVPILPYTSKYGLGFECNCLM
jgi:hypothetical protein